LLQPVFLESIAAAAASAGALALTTTKAARCVIRTYEKDGMERTGVTGGVSFVLPLLLSLCFFLRYTHRTFLRHPRHCTEFLFELQQHLLEGNGL
jgi:hypothetical protein